MRLSWSSQFVYRLHAIFVWNIQQLSALRPKINRINGFILQCVAILCWKLIKKQLIFVVGGGGGAGGGGDAVVVIVGVVDLSFNLYILN